MSQLIDSDNAHLYLAATQEFDEDDKNIALWAKALALCDGDQQSAKYEYIRLRVVQFENELTSPSISAAGIPGAEVGREPEERCGPNNVSTTPGLPLVKGKDDDLIQAIRDGFRRGQIRGGIWYLQDDEGRNPHGELPDLTVLTSDKHNSHQQFNGALPKLVRGGYGLATTYWIFGVLIGICCNILLQITAAADMTVMAVLMIFYFPYAVAVLLGIWRAADRYKGPARWAVLARIATALGWIQLLIGSLVLISALG